MPHGAPKKFTAFRLDPELLKAVQAAAQVRATNVTAAVEEGLRLWLTHERRQKRGPSLPRPPTPAEVRAAREALRAARARLIERVWFDEDNETQMAGQLPEDLRAAYRAAMSSIDVGAIQAMQLRLDTLWERNQEWREEHIEGPRREMLAERRREGFKVVTEEEKDRS